MDPDEELTVWCGNLPNNITEELLYELFLQIAPLKKVRIPKDKNYGFVTFKHSASVKYAIDIMEGTKLFERKLLVRSRGGGSTNNSPVILNMPDPVISVNQLLQLGAQLNCNNVESINNRPSYNRHENKQGGRRNNYREERRHHYSRNEGRQHENSNHHRNNYSGHNRYDHNDHYGYGNRRR